MNKKFILFMSLAVAFLTSCDQAGSETEKTDVNTSFDSVQGHYNNVDWDISSAESVSDKVAIYSLGEDMYERVFDSKSIIAKSGKLQMIPYMNINGLLFLDDYIKKEHDLGEDDIDRVNTEDYLDMTQHEFYKTGHLMRVNNNNGKYCSSQFLVFDREFKGLPIDTVCLNPGYRIISWDDHTCFVKVDNGLFKAGDVMVIYDDFNYPLQDARPITDEFVPIGPVDAVETVVNAVIDKCGSDKRIKIYDAELYYVLGTEWVPPQGAVEGEFRGDKLLIPLWRYDYYITDENGNTTDMGSVHIRADNGKVADNNDPEYVNAINNR